MAKIGEKIGFFAFFYTMISISSSSHPIVLIFCYLIHEMGHLFFAKVTGVDVKRLKVGTFRLRLSYDCSMVSYKRELLVCAGGVIFNVLFALIGLLVGTKKSDATSFFVICNFSLAFMNLYPISVLDGGGISRCICMLAFDSKKAEQVSKIISFASAFVLWLCAVYLQMVFDSNISLFFISVFLLIDLCFSV